MALNPGKAVDKSTNVERVIGKYKGNRSGTNVIFIGGMHGNEPAGVFAIKKVLNDLEKLNPDFKGNLIALAGNIQALNKGKRFIDGDLNRVWKRKPNGQDKKDLASELNEKKELVKELEKVILGDKSRTCVFDLHTTSSESIPFIVLGDTLRNRSIASHIPAPIILGLEEKMEGTLFNFLSHMGLASLIFESGQHNDPESIALHVAFIWLILEKLGCINPADIPEFDQYWKKIASATNGKRHLYAVKHRYHIKEDEQFKMKSGYKNFQKIQKGELVASSNNNEVRVKETGKIFMPLYQDLGEDGFFIIRRVKKFWLKVSKKLRELKLDTYLGILPGVKKHPTQKSTFIVNLAIARLFALEFFHLLGYRKEVYVDRKLVVSRREFDLEDPPREEIVTRFLFLKEQVM